MGVEAIRPAWRNAPGAPSNSRHDAARRVLHCQLAITEPRDRVELPWNLTVKSFDLSRCIDAAEPFAWLGFGNDEVEVDSRHLVESESAAQRLSMRCRPDPIVETLQDQSV